MTTQDPTAISSSESFQFASPTHWLGTDQYGRDVFTRIVYGGRVSLLISALAVVVATLVGGAIAIVAGYLGGWYDLALMRVTDVFMAIPALLIAIGLIAVVGPSGGAVGVALAIAYTPKFARVVRSEVVRLRDQPYVTAARSMGASGLRIIAEELMPNVLPILIVQVTAALAWGVLGEASLGFLGLGVQPPDPSWGSLLIEGRLYFFQEPWVPLFAGAAVAVAVLGFNLLGDGLRDVLDPRVLQRS
jgi:peptide/nickel transport system permease protein